MVCSRSSPLTSWTVAFFNGALSKPRITIPETTHVSSPALPFTLEAGFGEVCAKTTATENRLTRKARNVLRTTSTYSRSPILCITMRSFPRKAPSHLGDDLSHAGVSDYFYVWLQL